MQFCAEKKRANVRTLIKNATLYVLDPFSIELLVNYHNKYQNKLSCISKRNRFFMSIWLIEYHRKDKS